MMWLVMTSDIVITPGVPSYKGFYVDEYWGEYETITARPIPDFDGYFIGINGVAYSNKSRGGIVRPLVRGLNGKGTYWHYSLFQNGRNHPLDAHKLMATVYMGRRPSGHTISHRDGNKDNNSLCNLCWETYSDNHNRKKDHGTDDMGLKNSRSKFTERDIVDIKLRLANGGKVTYIAKDYGVRHSTISRIKMGKRYV